MQKILPPHMWECLAALAFFYGSADLRLVLLDHWGDWFYVPLRMVALTLVVWIMCRTRNKAVNVAVGDSAMMKLPYGDPLLFLRCMALLFVLMQHGFGVVFKPEDFRTHIWSNGFWLLLPSAWLGVWIFYVLSGYLMGKAFFSGRYALTKQGVKDFYVNRVLRIAPLYYITIIGVSIFVMPQMFDRKNITALISILSFDFADVQQDHPNAALWTVAVEMQFYLAVPIFVEVIHRILGRRGQRATWFVFAAVTGFGLIYRSIMYVDYNYWLYYIYTPFLGNCDLFLGGMVLAYALQRFPAKKIPLCYSVILVGLAYVVGALIVAATTTTHRANLVDYCYAGPTLGLLFAAPAIYIMEAAVKNQTLPDWFSAKVVRGSQVLGLLTYPIYACHVPIMAAIKKMLNGKSLTQAESVQYVALSLMITLLAAVLAHYLVEETLRRFKRCEAIKP